MKFASGSTFGPFRIIELLGKGGMASVYKAYQAKLDRHVALKVLPREFLHDDSFAKRFEREARVIARLEHPHIVPIYDYGIADDIPWMSMRLLPVGSLAGVLRRERLEPAQVVAILEQVAEALDHAHANGIIHRDVKPSNILVDDKDRVYVGDFGLAHWAQASRLSTSHMIAGTPQYMAPEQALGQLVDHRADIYALGIVAFEMLTGSVPFSADTPLGVLMKHVNEPLPIPSPDEVPDSLLQSVLKALAKAPEDRWQSATAFVQALEQALVESGVPSPAVDRPPQVTAEDERATSNPAATTDILSVEPPPAAAAMFQASPSSGSSLSSDANKSTSDTHPRQASAEREAPPALSPPAGLVPPLVEGTRDTAPMQKPPPRGQRATDRPNGRGRRVALMIACAAVVVLVMRGAFINEDGSSQESFTSNSPSSASRGAFESTPGVGGQGWPRQGWGRCEADMQGLPGYATLDSQDGLQVVYVGGQIRSRVAEYTFSGCELPLDLNTGAIVGSVCYADVADLSSNSRFQAELRFHQNGFVFVANPYGGGGATPYNFVCQ